MFGKLKQLEKKVRSFSQEKAMKEILKEKDLQAQIIDLNQKQLFEQGIDADGKPTGDYAPSTIYGTKNFPGKIEKGQRYDHITLKDTGEFYDSMQVKSIPEGIQIKADYLKEGGEDLRDEWPSAVGLTNESKQEIKPQIKESFMEKFKKHIKTS